MIVNRQIGVGDSKNGIVLDPLLTGHVIWRMRSGSVRLNYVKKSLSPLLPQNAPNMHNSQKCV